MADRYLDIHQARDLLAEQGRYKIAVYDARFAKPVDVERLRSLINEGRPILTLEDHGLPGGFGSCVIDACHEAGLRTDGLHCLGIPERWIRQDSRAAQLAESGLDPISIARTVREILDVEEPGQSPEVTPVPPASVEIKDAKAPASRTPKPRP